MRAIDAEQIAQHVVAALGGNIIQAELPESLATVVRDRCRHGSLYEVHMLTLLGPMAPAMRYTFTPSGAIDLELANPPGDRAWGGTLRPRPVCSPA